MQFNSAAFRFPRFSSAASGLIALGLLACTFGTAALRDDEHLIILQAGVQAEEDGAFVPADHDFLPGDFLYFTFELSGFSARPAKDGQSRSISLVYTVTAQSEAGVALAPPSSDKIEAELNPEDKNWAPKRRVSFLLPSYVPAGNFRVHLSVRDNFGNTEVSQDFPFRIGGVHIERSHAVSVQNFHFFRKEEMRSPLEIPAFRPGDTVYAAFDITGFQLDPDNQYKLSYDLLVQRPDGKPFLKQENAAELDAKSFYPAAFIPATFNVITTSQSSRGEYVVIITVHDKLAGSEAQFRTAFSLE